LHSARPSPTADDAVITPHDVLLLGWLYDDRTVQEKGIQEGACAFCRTHSILEPCLKFPSPKSLSSINPSRPIPTAISSVIGQDDVVVLQYAYSLEGTFWASCFKRFAIEYGIAISHASLRHALLAMTLCEYPSMHMKQQIEYHKREARRQLIRSIETPSMIHDGDVFAANMLAWVALQQGLETEALLHAKGLLAMIKHLKGGERLTSNMLQVFEPLVLDDAILIFSTLGELSMFRYYDLKTMFKKRKSYFHELCRTGTPPEAWQSPPLQALVTHLGELLTCSVSWLTHIVRTKTARHAVRKVMIDQVTHFIKSELSDTELKRDLVILEQLQMHQNLRGMENRLDNHAFVELRTIELLVIALEAPTLPEGLDNPRSNTIATSLVSILRIIGAPIRCPKYYNFYYHLAIGVAALALSRNEIPERTSIL
jgi:hypothetical protein